MSEDVMNLAPDDNFLLKAGLQYWEETDGTAVLYTGVLSVTLNRLITVMFVPHTRRTVLPWPPVLPENTDDVQTAEEARRVSLALASYAVMPDIEMAGREECVPYSGDEPPEDLLPCELSPGVIFYTTPDEYEALSDEVLTLILSKPGLSSGYGLHASALAGTALLEFLRRRVIGSPLFTPRDHRILSRGPGTK